MSDQSVIITGGNSGLGYECAKEIAASPQGWCIVIASRSQAKASEGIAKLTAQIPAANLVAIPLDLASLDSIHSFHKNFKARNLPPLHALVCNAGIQIVSGTTYTQDGFETTFGVNHLGHFLLTHLLLNQITPPARMIMVSSDTHDPAQAVGMPEPRYDTVESLAWPDKDPLPSAAREDVNTIGRRRYTTSKLCNILFAYELSRRLRDEGLSSTEKPVTVNAFNPGLMPGTGLARDYNPLMRFAWNTILPAIRSINSTFMSMNNVTDSGKALARLVLDPTLEDVSGKYFSGLREVPSSKESYDRQKALDLWQASVKLVKLTQVETPLRIH